MQDLVDAMSGYSSLVLGFHGTSLSLAMWNPHCKWQTL